MWGWIPESDEGSGGLFDDTRAASEVIGTLISLAMLVVFLSGTAVVSVYALDAVEESNAREQLEFRGEQLATTIEDVDRRVRGSASTNAIGTSVSLPERAGNEQYTIVVVAQANNMYQLELSLDGEDGEYTAAVQFRSETDVETGSVRGGDLEVIRKEGESQISIDRAGTN